MTSPGFRVSKQGTASFADNWTASIVSSQSNTYDMSVSLYLNLVPGWLKTGTFRTKLNSENEMETKSNTQ
jgi:hypothetical protein